MTTSPQSDRHLDADLLAAFAEDALTPAERTLCLAHLAECAHCREVAFLADAAAAEASPQAQPVRQPRQPLWLGAFWWPAFSLGGVAAVAVLVAVLHHRTAVPPAPHAGVAPNPLMTNRPGGEITPHPDSPPRSPAMPRRPRLAAAGKPTLPPPKAPLSQSASPVAGAAVAPHEPLIMLPLSNQNVDAVTPAPLQARASGAKAAPTPVFLGGATPAPLAPKAAAPVNQNAAQMSQDYVLRDSAGLAAKSFVAGSQVAGIVTDPTGAVVPRARIAVDANGAALHREGISDQSGRFVVGPLPPGTYRVEISAPGFSSQTREVQLGLDQRAQLDTALSVGAASETVEVASANAAILTESATVNAVVLDAARLDAAPQLASPNLQTSVAFGGQRLALDDAGRLLRNDHGHWKPVRGPWKSARITALSVLAASQFRVVTAAGDWTSADGRHWRKTP